jgi:hypothetical protein
MPKTASNQLENRMTANSLALMDKGDANRRILSKDQYRADFRRVEAASVKRKTNLKSAEGKRILLRCFYSFQASVYFISTLGRTKLPHESVELVEQSLRERLEAATKEMEQSIDGAEALFKQQGIENVATYDTVALETEIGITSALGRRYFELIHKLDLLMPLLQTLEIEEVISERQVEHQRSKCKRVVLALSSTARNLSAGIRRRMNEMDSKKAEGDARRATPPSRREEGTATVLPAPEPKADEGFDETLRITSFDDDGLAPGTGTSMTPGGEDTTGPEAEPADA